MLYSWKNQSILLTLLTFCLLAFPWVSSCAQTTFTSVASGSWGSAATWDLGSVPTSIDNVVIADGDTVSMLTSTTVNDLVVDEGGELELGNNKRLLVDGDLTVDGTIELLEIGSVSVVGVWLRTAGKTLSGNGIVKHVQDITDGETNGLFYFDADISIASGAALTFITTDEGYTDFLHISAGATVTNNGTINLNGIGIIATDTSSKWVNEANAYLSVQGAMMEAGTLEVSATGNTIEYSGDENQTIKKSTDGVYNHLILSGGGIKNLGADITVNGYVLISSTFNSNGYNLDIKGDWTNNGTFEEENSTVTFSGSSAQTISSIAGEAFYNLTVQKQGAILYLAEDLQVENSIDIDNGYIDSQSYILTLGTGSANEGILSLSGTAIVIGKFERWITQTGIAYQFPLGTTAADNLMTLTFHSLTAGTLITEFVASSPGSIASPPLVDNSHDIYNLYTDGYWSVSKDNGFVSADYDVLLYADGFSSFTPNYDTRIIAKELGSNDWEANGSHVDSPSTFVSPTIKRSGMSLFPVALALGENDDCSFPATSEISGSEVLCINSTNEEYTVVGGSGSSFSWHVSEGVIDAFNDGVWNTISTTTSLTGVDYTAIRVDWGSQSGTGEVSVIEDNAGTGGCGEGTVQNLSVLIHPFVGEITGSTNLMVGATATYQVEEVSGYTYTWVVNGGTIESGQGSNEITVSWGSTVGEYELSVTGSNTSPCGGETSPASLLNVNIYEGFKSVTSGNWEDGSTWTSGTVPTSLDNVRIKSGHTVTIYSNAVVNDLEVESGATLVIDNNQQLEVKGNLLVNGILQLDEGGAVDAEGGLLMSGSGVELDGTGSITSSQSLNADAIPIIRLDGNIKVVAGANLTFSVSDTDYSHFIEIGESKIITNYGKVSVNKDLIGETGSKWINKSSAYLSIEGTLLFESTAVLDARDEGNTIEYSGSGDQSIKLSEEGTYGNLILSGSGIKSLSEETTVTGDLTISATLDLNGFNLTLEGDWVNNGSFNYTTEKVIFSGETDQQLSSSASATFYWLEVSKEAGSLILTKDITVEHMLNLELGNIETQGYTLTLGTGTSNLGTLQYVYPASVSGFFKRWVNSTNKNGLVLPLGYDEEARYVELTFNNSPSGTIKGVFTGSDPGSQGLTLDDNGTSIFNAFNEGYWKLVTGDGFYSNDYDLSLTADGFESYAVSSSHVLVRANSNSDWTVEGTHVAATEDTANRFGMNTLSAEYTLGDITNCEEPELSSIDGATSICIESEETYIALGGLRSSTYSWSISGGSITGYDAGDGWVSVSETTSLSGEGFRWIKVLWSTEGGQGTLSVIENNSFAPMYGCGDSYPVTLEVEIHPMTLADITGTSSVGTSQTVTYSVDTHDNYTYNWTCTDPDAVIVGNGTSEVSITWGGTEGTYTVSVSAENTSPCSRMSTSTVKLDVDVTEVIVSNSSAGWENTTTWTPNKDLTATDNIRVLSGHTVTITTRETINNLEIEEGGKLVIDNNVSLEVLGDLIVDGEIESLESGQIDTEGCLTLSGDGVALSGSGSIYNYQTIAGGETLSLFRLEGNISIEADTDLSFEVLDNAYANAIEIGTSAIITNYGQVSINRSLIGNSGSIWENKSDAVLEIGGTLLEKGTLIANEAGNQITYSGESDQLIKQTSSGYYNLSIEGSGVKRLTANEDVYGDLTIGSSLDVTAFNYQLEIQGDFTVTGSFLPQSGKVTFNGTEAQSINSAVTFYDLELYKNEGVLYAAADITVSNSLSLKEGKFDTNAGSLLLGTGGSNSGSLDFSQHDGNASVVGPFSRWITSSGAYVFPVGTLGAYRYLTIDATISLFGEGVLTAEFVSESPSDNGLPTVDGTYTVRNIFPEGYWRLTNSSSNAVIMTTYDIDLDAESFTAFTLDDDTRVISRSNSSDDWIMNGTHESISPQGGDIIERNGLINTPLEFGVGDDTDCTPPTTSAITWVSGSECINSEVIYKVDNAVGSKYTWEVDGGTIYSGQGTHKVTVKWGDTQGTYTISVIENNSGVSNGCGIGTEITEDITLNPIELGSISGSTGVSVDQNGEVYEIEATSGYTYNWEVTNGTVQSGQGTSSITVDWGSTAGTGTIQVTATYTDCSVSSDTELTVTIYEEIESVASGDWDDTATWEGGVVPNTAFSVRVKNGHTVTITGDEGARNLVVESDAFLDINNNVLLEVVSNLDLNGTIRSYESGTIGESLNLSGSSGTIDGVGSIIHNTSGNEVLVTISGNKMIASTANLTLDANVHIESDIVITNYGVLSVGFDLIGEASTSKWVNKSGSSLSIAGELLSTGLLTVSEEGNTVIYSGANQNVTIPVSSYGNLSLEGTGTKSLVDNLVIEGNLLIASGATLDVSSSNYSLYVGGDWTNNGVFIPQSGTVIFDGVTDQYLTTETFYGLTTNKPSGTLIMAGDVLVTNALSMTEGNINTQTNIIKLGDGNIGTLNRITGTVIGTFSQVIESGNTFVFPVGSTSSYNPIEISLNSLSLSLPFIESSIEVSFIEEDPAASGWDDVNGANDSDDNQLVRHLFSEGYWSLQNNNIASLAFDVSLTAAGFESYILNTNNRVLVNNGGNWDFSGSHVTGDGLVVSRNTVTGNYSGFAVGAVDDCFAVSVTSIMGEFQPCISTSEVYTCNGSTGSTYSWQVSGGTIQGGTGTGTDADPSIYSGMDVNSVTVDWGSTGGDYTLKVTETTTCDATGTTMTETVSVNPVIPSEITGDNFLYPGTVDQDYSVSYREGYAYEWSILSGNGTISGADDTNTVTVDWDDTNDGEISTLQVAVKYVGDGGTFSDAALCGSAETQTLEVRFENDFPSANATITDVWSKGTSWTEGEVPPSGADVTIKSGDEIWLDRNDIRVNNLTVEEGGMIQTDGYMLTITGSLILDGEMAGNGNVTFSGTSDATISGNILNDTNDGIVECTLNANKSITISSGSYLFINDFVINTGVTITNEGEVTINNALSGISETTSVWTNNASAVLNIKGSFDSGRINASATGNTVYYSGADQSVRFPIGSPGSYYNLVLEGTGTKTFSGDIEVTNILIASTTALNSEAYTMEVVGDFTNNSTFVSSGTTVIGGSTDSKVEGTPVATSFNELVIDKSAGAFDLGGASNTSVSKSLVISNGELESSATLDISLSGNLIVERTGTLNTSNIGTVDLSGDFLLAAGGSFTHSTTAFDFSSASQQSINGEVTIYKLTKSGGGDLVLTDGNTTVENNLTLTSGNILTTSSSLLILGSGSAVSGGSTASFVEGPMRKVGDSNFTFTVGAEGVYAPLGISSIINGSASDEFTAEYINAIAPDNQNLDVGVERVSGMEYWNLTRDSGFGEPKVTLYWEDDERSEIYDTPNLLVGHYSGGKWVSECPCSVTGSAAEDGSIQSGTITTDSNVTSFSPFSYANKGGGNNPLPVEMIFFDARLVGDKAELHWATASEINADRFEVEKSLDGKVYNPIGTVAAEGNSLSRVDYGFEDENIDFGTIFYRLKQVDLDGKYELFGPEVIKKIKPSEAINLSVSPNPVTAGSSLLVSMTGVGVYKAGTIKLMDVMGESFQTVNVTSGNAGTFSEKMKLAHLPRGVYLVTITIDEKQYSKKLVIK
ncbi:T9SS type A sorting domain-containing protein [Limibacter armeniacum]|uniref:G8 domain-containing protein n=1 Tax=Limibacter armeniacum TaxID=466084 RepID=UPI002FE6A48C